MSLASEDGKQSHYDVWSAWEQNGGEQNTLIPSLWLCVVSWCALKEGFVPLEDFQTLLNIIDMLLWLSFPFGWIVWLLSYLQQKVSYMQVMCEIGDAL